MPGGHSLLGTRVSPSLGFPINPLNLPGLELYLRADTLAGADGSQVSTWPDSSGHSPARDASFNPVGLAKPILRKTGSQGGAPAVDFSAGCELDGSFPGSPGISNANGYTWYLYWLQKTLTPGVAQIAWQAPVNQGIQVKTYDSPAEGDGTTVNGQIGVNQNGVHLSATTTLQTTGWHMTVITEAPPSGSGLATYRQDDLNLINWTWTWTDIEGGYTVGASGSANRPLVGSIAAFLLFSQAHNETTIRGVERYLRSIYG